MKRSAHLILLWLSFSIWGCSNFETDPLGGRFDENFSGTLAQPADIDPAGTNSFSFAVFGDTHIGNPAGGVMRRVVSESKNAGDAFVAVAGDISDNADIGQFRQFKQIFADLSATYRAAIGNHDLYFDGWKNFKSEIGRSIYSFNADHVHIVVLDSGNGVLGEDQLNWLEKDLASTTQPFKVVVSHFPPHNGAFATIYRMVSDEESAILKDILHRHGVQLMISGHYHGHDERVLGGVRYIVSGAVNDLLDPGNTRHFIRVRATPSAMTSEIVKLVD